MLQRSKRRALLLVGPFAPPSGGIASHLDDLRRAAEERGATVRLLRCPALGFRLRDRLALVGRLAAARARGELVHLHENGHGPGSLRLVRLVGALAGRGAILTVHSGLAPDYLRRSQASARAAVAPFSDVVCVSPAIADALASVGVRPEKLHVAPAFSSPHLPPALLPAGLAAIRRRHAPLLGAVAGDGPEYGTAPLLEAFAVLARREPGAALVLTGPAARSPDTEALVRRHDLARRVFRFGDLRREESLAVLAACDAFVRPSLADGDSVTVREALSAGVRVVASDASARPRGVSLFHAGDRDSLLQALDDALRRPPPAPRAFEGLLPVLALYRARGLIDPAAHEAAAPAELAEEVA